MNGMRRVQSWLLSTRHEQAPIVDGVLLSAMVINAAVVTLPFLGR
jgi:hypothetical protein